MNRSELTKQIKEKETFLCIGLDPEPALLPEHLLKEKNPILEFNKQIIDATHDVCVAFKPNVAFYECYGAKGWQTLEETEKYIPSSCFKIADAKRGDIGNTSKKYADTFFKQMQFDAVTIAPYMGKDSIRPFLEYENKWSVVLALTSNEGSYDFQRIQSVDDAMPIYEHVLRKTKQWGTIDNTMYVVGATRSEDLQAIRSIIPDHFLLVPGVGAQGGSIEDVCKNGMNKDIGLLINAARSILYAGKDKDFAIQARKEAMRMNEIMKRFLDKLPN